MSASLYTAEFVFPGHPDKLSDAIADALVQEAIQREARALQCASIRQLRRQQRRQGAGQR